MSDSSQVRVVVRIRPLLAHELSNAAVKRATAAAGGSLPVQATRTAEGTPAVLLREEAAESVSLRGAASGGTESSAGGPVETLYAFDGVYEPEGPGSTNAALFDAEVGPHLASRLFAGSSVTLFAYGMTGTGKSHSMAGTAADPGLIPRSLRTLFDAVADRVACGEQDWDTTNITFSFFELYNEKIYDLLKPYVAPAVVKTDRSSSDSALRADPTLAGDLPVREDASGRVFVAGLSEAKIDSVAAFEAAYKRGLANRRVASTKLNAVSSRSHSMAVVRMEYRSKKAPFKRVTARLQMLDLAGNEDNRHSGNTSNKSRIKESCAINNSLFVLGKVINGLNGGDHRIAYRDSKLTRLLQDSLGGSNYAIMLCAISPNPSHLVWTARTLQFANKSRQIVNVVQHNVVELPPAPLQRETLQEEIERKRELRAKLDAWKAQQLQNKMGGAAAAATAAASAGGGAAAAAASSSSSSSAKRFVPGLLSRTGSGAGFPVPQSGPSDGSSMDLSALSALISAQQNQNNNRSSAKLDPAVMRKLESLAQDVSSMKAAMVVQARQQQQHMQQQQQHNQKLLQQRPTSAPVVAASASSATVAAASMSAPSSTPMVPLTPMSSASLARISVEKARVWERAGALGQALAEYREAARIRPGNEKLGLKIQQLEEKYARLNGGVGAAPVAAAAVLSTVAAASARSGSSSTLSVSGHKHARADSATSTSISVSSSIVTPVRASKQARRLQDACIAEGDENEEEDDEAAAASEEEEDEEEEEEQDESDATMSDASDYDPAEDEPTATVNRLWTRSTRTATRRGGSAETSPSADNSSSSLLQRITASTNKTPPPATAAVAASATAAAAAVSSKLMRPASATSPAAASSASSAAPAVRTPLSSVANKPAAAALSLGKPAAIASSKPSTPTATAAAAKTIAVVSTKISLVTKVSPKTKAAAAIAASKAAAAPAAPASSSPVIPAAAVGKENAVPAATANTNAASRPASAKTEIAAVTKPKPSVTKTPAVAPAPSTVVAAPAGLPPVVAGSGLLLSNLVSGRDALLRVLNSGSLKELMNLQTIGKKRAQLILAKRDELLAAASTGGGGGSEAGGNAYVTLADLAHIGLSETQIEQFTQRNIIANIIAGATAMEE